jgi:hypothetical protein
VPVGRGIIGSMALPRDVELSIEAAGAIRQILGIMTDQLMGGDGGWDWDLDHVVALDARLELLWESEEWQTLSGDDRPTQLEIDDVALVLDGMAFTEVASADFPWIEMVRWSADFITAELRQHWTDEEWHAFQSAGPPRSIY